MGSYWYNKRSGRSEWEAPADVFEQSEGKQVLKRWLEAQCKACDADNSGELDKDEFEVVLKTIWLPLNLQDEDARELRKEAGADVRGAAIEWQSMVIAAPKLLHQFT